MLSIFRKQAPNEQPSIVRRVTDYFFGWFGSDTIAGPKNQSEALAISAVYGCVRIISDDIGKLPIRLMKRTVVDGIEKVEPAKDHPYFKLLSQKPNEWQTSTEFIRTISTHAALGKGSLSILAKDGKGIIHEIMPVPSGSWTQEQHVDGKVTYLVQMSNGQSVRFSQDQVLFVRGPVSLDGYSGVGFMSVAMNAMRIIEGLEKQSINFAANSGRPSGILTSESDMTDEQKSNLKATWDAAFGAGGKGGTAVLDFAMKYHPLGMSFADSQYVQNRDFQIREIARFFRIDPSYLFVAGTKTYASAEMTRREHYQNAIMPYIVLIEQALNKYLLDDSDEYFFDFDDADFLRGSPSEQADYLARLLGAGGTPSVISINEARRELGYHELSGERFELPMEGGYAASVERTISDDDTDEQAISDDDTGENRSPH